MKIGLMSLNKDTIKYGRFMYYVLVILNDLGRGIRGLSQIYGLFDDEKKLYLQVKQSEWLSDPFGKREVLLHVYTFGRLNEYEGEDIIPLKDWMDRFEERNPESKIEVW